MIETSLIDNMQSLLLTNPSDFAQIGSFFETEVLNLEPSSRPLIASDVPSPLNLPKLKVLSVNHCELTLRRILDEQTLAGIAMICIANSSGCLLEMDGLRPTDLYRLNLLNLTLCADEMRWICNQPGLISLQFVNCLNLPTRTLSSLSCKGLVRSLALTGSWDVLRPESLEDCFPATRFLDLSKIRIPPDVIDLLPVAFPNIECFYALGCGLNAGEIDSLASSWSALKILQTGNRETDFYKHHSSQWAD